MPYTNKNPAAHRAFADFIELGLDTSVCSDIYPNFQPLSESTPASRDLAKFHRERRKLYPVRKRPGPYTGKALPFLTEAN